MANRKQNNKKNSRFYVSAINQLLTKSKTGYRRTIIFIRDKPLTSFFLILLILLILIVTGNFLTAQKPEAQKKEIIKNVQIYQIGQRPKVSLQAKIEKSGVIKINSLTAGIIQSINFKEGMQVDKGAVLVNMSSNYQGGNAFSVARQIAQKQYQNAKDTFDTQKDVLKIQRDIISQTQSNASQLRDIQSESIQDTQGLIDLNQSILDTLSQNEADLEKNNTGGVNDTAILQIKSQRAQTQASLNQLRSGLRQTQFQAASDKPPAELATLQKDLTLKQLDIQQKTLELGIEVSRLQLILAQINEALFFPTSPFTAIVQRVYAKEGQSVIPGTPLLTISATEDPITAVVNLPQNLAGAVSSVEPSLIHINDKVLDLNPNFISTEATDGTLYSVIYIIPDEFSKDLTEGGNITVEIPIGLETNSAIPFIPLDAVYQSSDKSNVLVVEKDKAISKTVILGNVFGKFVEVRSGLLQKDKVILNRNILTGDKVLVQ